MTIEGKNTMNINFVNAIGTRLLVMLRTSSAQTFPIGSVQFTHKKYESLMSTELWFYLTYIFKDLLDLAKITQVIPSKVSHVNS